MAELTTSVRVRYASGAEIAPPPLKVVRRAANASSTQLEGHTLNELTLTGAGLDYLDRARPLIDGRVKPAGIAYRYLPLGPTELFRRVVQTDELDVAEMSFSTYLNLLSNGDRRYVA